MEARRLVNIGLETLLLFEVRDKRHGFIRGKSAMLASDVGKRPLDILRHALRVAADIEMGALLKPSPDVPAGHAHAVLDIEFFAAVARPGQREPCERPRRFHRVQFIFIEEVAGAPLMAEKQPALASRADCAPLLQKRAERRHAGSRTHHDDRR